MTMVPPCHPSDRRTFLRAAAGTLAFGYASLREDGLGRVRAAVRNVADVHPEALAGNESFWFQVQRAYDVDRSCINLNNGGVAPAPDTVMRAMYRHLASTNELPARQLWQVLDPKVETVRTELARTFGCDAEEIAITRNASEALETLLLGIDLSPGDEVLTTTYDYPRMIQTLRQRALREGIVLRQFSVPALPDRMADLTGLFEQHISPRTRMILVSHVGFLNGQIFPVRDICALGRRRGIEVVVDGAHAFAHLAFTHADLDCDYYATSLHKWLSAPIGTGFLYIRKPRIAPVWPLMAPPDPRSDNIRKFEEIGTHPDAPRLAVAEALLFYHGLGPMRKQARLRFLRDRWAKRLTQSPRVTLFTRLDHDQSCGIATVAVEGISGETLTKHLWNAHRIFVTPIMHEHIDGIRVTPNVYTTLGEIDLFCEAVEKLIRNGVGG